MDALRVSGNYIATKFIIPGNNDGSVNVLANGGMISAILSPDFRVKGKMIIPKHPNLSGDGFNETFEGYFTMRNDSLQFKSMYNFLSIPQLYFINKPPKLEGQLNSISPIIITLEKL